MPVEIAWKTRIGMDKAIIDGGDSRGKMERRFYCAGDFAPVATALAGRADVLSGLSNS